MEDNLGIGRLRLKSVGLHRQAKLELARLEKPRPIVPRRLVRGVVERIDFRGCVLVFLDRESVLRAVDELIPPMSLREGGGACAHLPGMASGKLRMIDEITSF
jgi:hypothetical protein